MAKDLKDKADPTRMVGLQLRFREGLRAQVEEAAKLNGQSMNAEIISRLERSFASEGELGGPWMRMLLKSIAWDGLRIETMRGMSFKEDRAASLALAEIASSAFKHLGAAVPNSEAIRTVLDLHQNLEESMNNKLGYLREVGAIGEPLNALLLYGPEPKDDRWSDTLVMLRTKKVYPRVDLSISSARWELRRDGELLTKDELVGVAAVLRSVGDMRPAYESLADKLKEATAAEDEAKREASRIVEWLQKRDQDEMAAVLQITEPD